MAARDGADGGTGSARRRRERRLRSMLRHERMTVAMALAEKLHHSSRGQRMARAGEEDLELHYTAEFRTHPPPQAAGTVYFAMDVDDVPAALGSQPDRLSEVRPQERAQRRTVQQIVDPVPLPTLDDPAPQMVGQLLNLAHFLDTPLPDPEQFIAVPKILSDDVPMRALVRETQLAEQLVEVPTIVSWSLLQGFPPGQASTTSSFSLERISERIAEQNVEFPVGGGLQDFLPLHLLLVFVVLQMCLGKGFFALFPVLKKVRSWARTRGRNCSPSRAHPRRQPTWTRCREWSFWPSSSSSLTRLGTWVAWPNMCGRGSCRISTSFTASSPMRGIVLSNLRPGPTRLRETMMVRGDGIECSVLVTSLRSCSGSSSSSSISWCLQFSSSTEWWTFQLHADLGTHSAHCTADSGDLTVTVLGMVVDAPVAVQRQVLWLGCAENCGAPQWQFWVRPALGLGCCARWCNDWEPCNAWFDFGSMLCIFLGGLWKNFMIFYVTGCLGS